MPSPTASGLSPGVRTSGSRASDGRPTEAATPVKSPPSLRVAEVSTTARSLYSPSRSSPETLSGATRSEAVPSP